MPLHAFAKPTICKPNQPTESAQNVSKLEFSSWDRGFWLCIANLHTCQWICNIGIRSPCNNAPHTHKQRHTYISHTQRYFCCTLYIICVTQRNTWMRAVQTVHINQKQIFSYSLPLCIFSDHLFLYQKSDNTNFGREVTGTSDQT